MDRSNGMHPTALRTFGNMGFHGKGGSASLADSFIAAAFNQLVFDGPVMGIADKLNQFPAGGKGAA